MNLRELTKSTFILILGMFYHKYVVYMMDLAETMNEKPLVTNVVEPVEIKVIKPIEIKVEKKVKPKKRKIVKLHVTATMYYPVVNQCDKDPLVTAGMFKINPRKASEHKWIAMSRNLLKRWGGNFDYGDLVMIKNAGKKNGVYKVTDTMNERYKDRIDILETEGTSFYKFNDIQIAKL